uniref:Advillin-like n=1 Tax=Callorhinchus milii TaxID=7868 RepID=A0A4W3GQU3_CALMI
MSWKSFNAGDVFLLDLGNVIIQWNGPQSNSSERLKGTLLAKDIRDRERGGRTPVGIVEGDKEQDSAELMKVLVSVLGKRPERLQPPTSDKRAAEQHRTSISLYQYVPQAETRKWAPV